MEGGTGGRTPRKIAQLEPGHGEMDIRTKTKTQGGTQTNILFVT